MSSQRISKAFYGSMAKLGQYLRGGGITQTLKVTTEKVYDILSTQVLSVFLPLVTAIVGMVNIITFHVPVSQLILLQEGCTRTCLGQCEAEFHFKRFFFYKIWAMMMMVMMTRAEGSWLKKNRIGVLTKQ